MASPKIEINDYNVKKQDVAISTDKTEHTKEGKEINSNPFDALKTDKVLTVPPVFTVDK
jgi:hypothetical protein